MANGPDGRLDQVISANNRLVTAVNKKTGSQHQQARSYYYAYGINLLAIAAANNTVATGQILIAADSAFEWLATTMGCNQGGTDVSSSYLATLQITDTSSSNNMFQQAVYLLSVAGTAQLPYYLPRSRVFNPNTTLNFQVTSLGNAAATDVYLTLHGRKVIGLQLPQNI